MMRYILLICFLIPVVANAQLDRIRTDMTEPEFIKAFPEAHRDYESEATWVSKVDSLEGAIGYSMWRVYKDSIAEYGFRSWKVDGPSYRFTTVDSSKVHKLRVSAMKVEAGLEKIFGKPTTLSSRTLLERPLDPDGSRSPRIETANENEIYSAEWNFDDGKIIAIKVTTDLTRVKRINTPANQRTQLSESYEFMITVTRPVYGQQWNFEVGSSATQFEVRHPGVLALPVADRFYEFTDSMRAPCGQWRFRFRNGKFSQINYTAYNGTAKGDRQNNLSYSIDKNRAEKLLDEGTVAFGKPDSIVNRITLSYDSPDPSALMISYNRVYLTAVWYTTSGPVRLEFEEWGGGNNRGVTFSIRVVY